MRILLAPNAMKGSLSASDFADAISDGLLMADDSLEIIKHPLADGGDGTNELLINKLGGIFIQVPVHDPVGRQINSRYGWLAESKCAIIEMAEASGLNLLTADELNPMVVSSRGTGELILAAVKNGVQKIILGIGGSATVDGGTGMLMALGFTLLDHTGNAIEEGGNGLIQIAQILSSNVRPEILKCEIVIATDVKNPLLGAEGAAVVYGPQKGATPQMVKDLELGLKNYITVLEQITQKKLVGLVGGGAAGGIAVPLIALLNARVEPGAELIIKLLGVMEDLKSCDLVITGEGCIDLQTCQGKGPAVIANAAREAGIPVIAIGGAINPEASPLFDGIFSITSCPITLEEAMSNSYELTKSLSYQLGKFLKIFTK